MLPDAAGEGWRRGVLRRRYKRFLADVRLDGGEEVTAHVANPGAMTGLAEPGATVWLEHDPSPRRRLAWSWRLVETAAGARVGVDTGAANRLVGAALAAGELAEFVAWPNVARERAYGAGSRVDFFLSGPGRPDLYLEVKSVTLSRQPGLAEFPDTRTARGTRHLCELAAVATAGARAAILYVVQRADCRRFAVAADIDPDYAAAAATARAAGVATVCRGCRVAPARLALAAPLAETLPETLPETGRQRC